MRSSLVVIPTYNEAESIGEILNALKPLDCDVLVIDDGSPDGTAQIVRGLGIEVIERQGKQGLGSAYRAGFSLAIDRGLKMDRLQIGASSASTFQNLPMLTQIFCCL